MASVDVIARIEASVNDGGWKMSGAVLSDADRLDFYQLINSWFYLYTSAGWESSPRPAFHGRIIPDPWRKFFQHSEAPFSALGAADMMKRGEIQGIYYRDVASSPANRHQIIDMSYAKIAYEIVSGHCNLMHEDEAATYDTLLWSGSITSQTFPEGFLRLDIDTGSSTEVEEWEVKQGNFWSRLKELADTEFYQLYVDKDDTLHYIPHPMFEASLPTPVLTLTASHLLQPLEFERRHETVGQVLLSGTTPGGSQLSGRYPAIATGGPRVHRSGYVATSNAKMNAIAERMYKYETRDYTVTAELPGAIGLMLELLDRVAITYTSTPDGIAFSSKKFWLNRISVEILSNFKARTTLVLDSENA